MGDYPLSKLKRLRGYKIKNDKGRDTSEQNEIKEIFEYCHMVALLSSCHTILTAKPVFSPMYFFFV